MEDGDYVSSASSSDDIIQEKDKSFSASNRRVLTQVLARKDRDAKKVHELLRLAFSKLDQETQRAVDAERRATECLVRARNAIDARTLAEAEAARTREELGMYKVQLDQAQREILRAQEVLDSLEARRRDAEDEAARARSVARKLQEQRAVDLAREEGRKAGWREGVERGWRMGWEEALEGRRVRNGRTRPRPRRSLQEVLFEDEGPEEPRVEYEQSSEESSLVNVPSRGVPEAGNGFALPFDGAPHEQTHHIPAITTPVPTLTTPFRPPPPDSTRFDPGLGRQRTHERVREQSRHRTPEPTYVRYQTPDPVPIRYQAPDVRRHHTHEPRFAPPATYDYVVDSAPAPIRPTTPSSHSRPYGPHDDEPSPIRPLASFLSPIHRPISVPPDGFIPYALDLANDTGQAAIRLPPPHELADPIRGRHNPVVVISTPEGGSPAPVGSASDDGPRASTSRMGDMRNGSAPRRPPVPPSAIPPRISKEPSSHSRASTHLSEYELLHPPQKIASMRIVPQKDRELCRHSVLTLVRIIVAVNMLIDEPHHVAVHVLRARLCFLCLWLHLLSSWPAHIPDQALL
ncbi:hypothetical protein HETIRDRAFT_448282 [Heterobasidion irregulare TC 32-1]|uniref:Uncharacterized protein n=1 Tax=Heterobasidion irregulare (strain TC 32-1) TaxID=747525 RepID=W4KGQ0_HETIT|nr:uncharacterized protein HETIRDRAFT_448282 [Heterobasidion irregulare TC 32-1]ETW85022.1 hypothetical protein HETIRDRAFT_448282 [Heterobasidion irregulare TC 32-1]